MYLFRGFPYWPEKQREVRLEPSYHAWQTCGAKQLVTRTQIPHYIHFNLFFFSFVHVRFIPLHPTDRTHYLQLQVHQKDLGKHLPLEFQSKQIQFIYSKTTQQCKPHHCQQECLRGVSERHSWFKIRSATAQYLSSGSLKLCFQLHSAVMTPQYLLRMFVFYMWNIQGN